MRAFDAALSLPWAMQPEALEKLLSIAARENEVTPEVLEAYRAAAVGKAETLEQRGGVAILNIIGPLFRRANLFTEVSGATSYDVLRRDLQVAVDDPSLIAILANLDTPGGDANGVNELAQAISAASAIKPVVAYVGGDAMSGGYWLASAASEIVVADTALLGSVGAVLSIRDTRARDTAAGVKTYEFVSSQSPHKRADPATEAGSSQFQRLADDLAEVFISTVARNRRVSVEDVVARFGGGGVLVGAKAVAAGMADRLGTFEETLNQLQNRGRSPGRSTPRSAKGNGMSDTTQPGAAEFDALRTSNQALTAQVSDLTTKLADRERRDAIMALDEAKGREAQARELCDAGVTAEAAKKILAAAPAPASEEEEPENPEPTAYERSRATAAGLNGGKPPAGKGDKSVLAAAVARTNKRF